MSSLPQRKSFENLCARFERALFCRPRVKDNNNDRSIIDTQHLSEFSTIWGAVREISLTPRGIRKKKKIRVTNFNVVLKHLRLSVV